MPSIAFATCSDVPEISEDDAPSREPTYARVDLVDTPRGPVLMEVELIEPVLFLRSCSSASHRIADAVARQISSPIRRPLT
ncbi:MAG: hypothetical protein Q8R01_17965 [Ramlibacter sp.]|nr:hypothetical protein [Ramlibacter sp.]